MSAYFSYAMEDADKEDIDRDFFWNILDSIELNFNTFEDLLLIYLIIFYQNEVNDK